VLDLDGTPQPLHQRTEAREADVTIGADGFSYTRAEESGAGPRGFKLGSQV
jgi:catechol 2,3-dioxygenase